MEYAELAKIQYQVWDMRRSQGKANPNACPYCFGTGYYTYYERNEKTRKFYGEIPQEYSIKCSGCNGSGKRRGRNVPK